MRTILACTCFALIAACQSVPNVPETVTVVVEKQIPVPAWATAPIKVSKPAEARTGRQHLTREDALDKLVDYVLNIANCHRRLLTRLDKGEAVDPKHCEKP